MPFFILAILAGFFGTPAGNRNFGIVFVWIVWWGALILLLLPFAGRLWCAICPIPAPGEWLQRRALVQPRAGGKLYTLGWKWHRKLKNIWLQNFSFLAVALFSVVILTTPLVSSIVLALFALIALAMSLVYERRAFCRYLCPVGGFIGLYSQLAPIELRVKDHAVCASHKDKTCYVGSDAGYGCPWLVFPGALDKNTYCGLCTECLKTCPLDNVALYARPFGADLFSNTGRRLDEAYKAFIMLTCALAYSIVLISPWSILKETAYAVGSPGWWVYAVAFLAANLVIVPGIFYAGVTLAKKIARLTTPTKKLFVEFAYALVPLGLAAWIAFSVSFVLINFSYAWQVVSDPFGWGWNLFGTADWEWTPYFAGAQAFAQIPILLIGLVAAIGIAIRTAQEQGASSRTALPVIAFCVAYTLALIWLYV
ncbi:MAG: 4Fe-4S binding protein [Chloroflexi bacterium]|nr:4Fe-4S binding protein [Chloroflexota bacterium]